jgi:hypothetical protein
LIALSIRVSKHIELCWGTTLLRKRRRCYAGQEDFEGGPMDAKEMDARDLMPSEAVAASIQKDFEAYEGERRRAAGQVGWQLPLFFGLLVIVAVVLLLFLNDFSDPSERWFSKLHIALYCGVMAGGFLAYRLGMKPATDLQQSFRAHLLPVILGFVTDVTYRHGVKPVSFARLPKEASGSFDRYHFDDVISGTYEGFPFELYETHLTRKRQGNRYSVQRRHSGVPPGPAVSGPAGRHTPWCWVVSQFEICHGAAAKQSLFDIPQPYRRGNAHRRLRASLRFLTKPSLQLEWGRGGIEVRQPPRFPDTSVENDRFSQSAGKSPLEPI